MAGDGPGCVDCTPGVVLVSALLSTAIPVRSNCSRRKTRRVSSAICCRSCCSSSDCLESVTLWHQWLRLPYAKVKTQAKRWSSFKTAGKLDLGQWQRVFYAEFDGQRRKRLITKVMGEEV